MRGTIRRRPGKKHDDAWELAVDLDRDPISGKRRRLYKVFKGTRKEAEKALTRMLQDADNGPAVDPTRETVAEYFERWLRDYVETNVAPKTRMYYAQVAHQHIIPRLGRKKLQQLRPVDIVEAERYWLAEGWRRTATPRGLSPKSVANIHRILQLAFRHAVE